MLYVRAEPSASEKGRGEPGERARASERAREGGARRKEFAKNRGSFGYRQKSLVMVVEENEQEEEADDGVWKRRGEGRAGER